MPKLTPGAKTTDMSAAASQMRGGTPWGRIRNAVRYMISGVTPDVWMSPNQPVEPVAQDAWGRNRDYPVGYNLFWTPRGGELTSFAQLRALSENCDLVRLAIETRKDQMAALKWTIAHLDPSKDKTVDPQAVNIEQMFQCPDGQLDWDSWLRMLLEDLLVIDAPAVLVRRLNNGTPCGFEVIDGATIKTLIDDSGRRPQPPSPAYQQALKGMPAVDYTTQELIYRPRNLRSHKFYGYSQVEQIMMTVNVAIRRALSQLQYYTEGNIPAAFVNVPANWTPQQIEQFQAYWDTVIEGDQAQKRKVRFVPEGTKPATLNEPPLKDEFDEWLARVVCYCFSLPPTAFVKQMNRSTSETQKDTADSEGLAPLMQWVKSLMDFLIQRHLGAKNLQFKWVEDESLDPSTQSTILGGYQSRAVYSINEVRAKLGEDPIPDPAADEYFFITATGAIPLQQALEPPQPPPMIGQDPNNPQQPGGAPPAKVPPKPAPKPDEVAEKGGPAHLHKAMPELTEPMKKLLGVFGLALDEVRQAAIKQLAGMEKASTDDRDQSRWDNPEDWAAEFVREMDTGGLSLAWDDYSDTLHAVSADGARIEVARIVQDDPTVKADADSAGFDMLDHQDPRAIEWADTHAAEMLTSDGTGGKLADSTRDMIRDTITEALKNGSTNDELAKALQEAYAFSEPRAELIARDMCR